jgi:DNA invertase Pin-like site-specific DNA recombinase
MAVYGYARCSTNEGQQDIERQIRELEEMGATRAQIFFEYEHGDKEDRKEFKKLLATVKPGDTIAAVEISRITRSTKQLCELIEFAKAQKIRLAIKNSITIDCTNGQMDPMSAAFLQMAGVFSELELSMIRTRVRSGLQNAKAKGKRLGRPVVTVDKIPPVFIKHYPQHKAGLMNVSELARICGMSRPTVYKYIGMMESAPKRGAKKAVNGSVNLTDNT